MTDYRGDGPNRTTDTSARRVDVGPGGTSHVERKSGGGFGRTLIILLAILAILAAIGFATGFFSADSSGGSLPEVSVKGGALPDVDVDSKSIDVTTEKQTIEVPTLEVTEGKDDKDGADKN